VVDAATYEVRITLPVTKVNDTRRTIP
jgi:hypothetical protein